MNTTQKLGYMLVGALLVALGMDGRGIGRFAGHGTK